MNGKGNVRFSDLFADTLNTHGISWGIAYYLDHGMPEWEVEFWFKVCAPNLIHTT